MGSCRSRTCRNTTLTLVFPGAKREVTGKDKPGSGVRTELEPIEMPLKSTNMEKVYSALRHIGKEFNIPDEQWETVTNPIRAHDEPVNWRLTKKNPSKPKGPKWDGNLKTYATREVVIFAPQCVLDSTLPVEQRRQDFYHADQHEPAPQLTDHEIPEELPSVARDFTFGHMSVDKEKAADHG